MMRRPPRSTLFPYTDALPICTRRGSAPFRRSCSGSRRRRLSSLERLSASRSRSEEHTSELQSRENLVCRLLLEKKKEVPGADHLGSLPSRSSRVIGHVRTPYP